MGEFQVPGMCTRQKSVYHEKPGSSYEVYIENALYKIVRTQLRQKGKRELQRLTAMFITTVKPYNHSKSAQKRRNALLLIDVVTYAEIKREREIDIARDPLSTSSLQWYLARCMVWYVIKRYRRNRS